MTTSTTLVGDRRRAALERKQAQRRHPSGRNAKPAGPPPVAFYVVAVVATIFTLLGLVMVLSATAISQYHKGNSPWRIFNRQVMWAGLGVIGLWVAMRMPMRTWRRVVVPGFVATCCMMVLPFLPGIGASINDARSWVVLGPVSFQPSEFLKLALLLLCADFLTRRRDEVHDPRRTLLPVLAMGGLAAALCLAQGDLGSAIVLAAIMFCVVFIAGAPLLPLTAAGALGGVGALAFVASSPRRQARFTAFLDIAAHKDHLSYQTWQAGIGIVQGGLLGEGPGQGRNKLGEFLPLAHSDFIFAVIAEELGFIGVVLVLGGFLVLAYAGIQVAMATQDHFHALVAGGITAWLVVQAIINVGGVTGMMPVTGLTLPFFSAGGSSLFVTMTATGLLLNVARNVR